MMTMLYADDMQMYIHCSLDTTDNAVNQINADLVMLCKWCKDHGLSLNASKCKPIVLGTSRMLSNMCEVMTSGVSSAANPGPLADESH
ncbi:hypothetical protein J6590_085085 [Homalodisca vitripennis]|nr:hypothetical protein J6590_085085 [Homalodisca vitripennis]